MARVRVEGVHRKGRPAGGFVGSGDEVRNPPHPERRDWSQPNRSGQPVSRALTIVSTGAPQGLLADWQPVHGISFTAQKIS